MTDFLQKHRKIIPNYFQLQMQLIRQKGSDCTLTEIKKAKKPRM